MSVLVKGMEMPKMCSRCPLRYVVYLGVSICQVTNNRLEITRERANDCPLIEVPPHGRLIDADAFDERVRVAGGMSEEELTEDFKGGVQTVLYILSKQHIIIEAEGSES